MRRHGKLLNMTKLVTALGLGLAMAAGAQQSVPTIPDAAQQDQGMTTITARSTLVLVPATVRTKGGEPVFTLEAKDFVVTDDGLPQKVRLEEDSGSLPLALVVVVEAGADGASKLQQYGGLGTMVEAIAGAVPHKVELVGFDSEAVVVQPWTESFERMNKALADLGPGDQKGAVLDALALAVEELKQQPVQYRRTILLVSETVDHGSKTKINDALRAVSDTNTVIYSLGFSSTRAEVKDEAAKLNSDKPGPPHGCMGEDPTLEVQPGKVSQAYDCLAQLAPPLRLAKLAVIAALGGLRTNVPETVAKLTGGEYFKFENAKGLEKGLQAISNRMPNRYFLSFQPVHPHVGLHAVGVDLAEPRVGVVVEARKSYWAESVSQP